MMQDSSKVVSAKLFMGMRYVRYCLWCISMNECLWMQFIWCKINHRTFIHCLTFFNFTTLDANWGGDSYVFLPTLGWGYWFCTRVYIILHDCLPQKKVPRIPMYAKIWQRRVHPSHGHVIINWLQCRKKLSREKSLPASYNFRQPFESYVETCTSFCVFRTQKADRLGRLLDPYPIALTLVLSLPVVGRPCPGRLSLRHHWQWVYLLLWCNLPSVASTGPIFKSHIIVKFVTLISSCNLCLHRLIKMHRNDTKSVLGRMANLK